MYQIKCDEYTLFDLRVPELIVTSPRVKVEVNTVGECSFTIYDTHPYYDKLQELKSVIEVSDEIGVIFRGRMTNNTLDFNNCKSVDIEGVMAYFNDSIVRPYNFPEDFLMNDDFINSTNVIEFFLKWLIDNHNSQVQNFQKFKLGNVTVSDPNNYITRSDTGYKTTWEILKSKLFESDLGGHLCIRYEKDGNYIDYLSEFELTNYQTIEFGKNLLDITTDRDVSATFTAIIPVGGDITDDVESDIESDTEKKKKLTIQDLPDGDITDDIVKVGDTLYSKSAVEKYGWIYAPVSETTWNDVTIAENLLNNGVSYLSGEAIFGVNTIEISAVDLHFSDETIASFRIYRNVRVTSLPHQHNDIYQLTKLDIDLLNPQNTKITVGNSGLSLVDINSKEIANIANKNESVEKNIEENKTKVTQLQNRLLEQNTTLVNTCNEIIMSALENYVETSNYEEFRETVEAQLVILSDSITMNFTTTTEQINDVGGDLQTKFTELYKYIRFSEDGIEIGDSATGLTLSIDNDKISFKKSGQQIGWWDGVDFHTGNIMIDVDEKAQFGNFAYIPRSDGSLMFLKVGG